jgi:NADPH2:quinone reductase
MKAHALTGFGSRLFELLSLPDPSPGPGQVLIRNHAAGVNNIDLLIRRGALPEEVTPLPHVLGVEGAGVVEGVGSEVEDLNPGDRVIWFGGLGAGGYGPYTVVEAAYAAKIADTIPFELAAATPVAYATAQNNIFTYGAPDPGDWILVHSAAGGVGAATLQVARNAGFKTIALTTSSKLDFVRAQGATVAIDRNASDIAEQILQVTGDKRISLSLNSVGGSTIMEDLKVLASFGQIVSFGHLGGMPEGAAADLLMPSFNRSVAIRTSDIYTLWKEKKDKFRELLRKIADDLLRGTIRPHVHRTFPVAAALIAHQELESGGSTGKVVLLHDD